MAPKKGLGRGLSSLFGETPVSDAPVSAAEFDAPSPAAGATVGGEGVGERLRIVDVMPSPEQPRKQFEQEPLEALADSIRRYGVLQPITVRRRSRDGKYLIIAGERRWRAARMAGLEYIPAHVVEADDRLAAELALIENLQREDLNPIEEAEGYKSLMENFDMTQEQVSEVVGRSRSLVSNMLRLLSLEPEVRELIRKGQLSAGHARALITLNAQNQKSLASTAVDQRLSVRETERIAKKRKENENRIAKGLPIKGFNHPEKKPAPAGSVEAYLEDISQNLSQIYERKVRITGIGGQGKVEFEYYNLNDLNRILEVFLKLTEGGK